MTIDPRAGHPATPDMLIDVPRLMTAYYGLHPDPSKPEQRVRFGTSGHRGSAFDTEFNEDHIAAITQAICEYRSQHGIDGPLFLGADTHALSASAWASALEVLAAHGVEVRIDQDDGYTPTPVISHAIVQWNRSAMGRGKRADGIVVTPSHNPPRDGGFKYNPPHGGPADTQVTGWIEARANHLLNGAASQVRRVRLTQARNASTTGRHDFRTAYIGDLAAVIEFDLVRRSGLRLGVDPLGGAGVAYWGRIAEQYKLPLTVVSTEVDPTFRFMTVDWDGQIRMDCSSPYAMQRLIGMQHQFDVAWACDTDHDRHGIVAGSSGLMNPNHFLAVAIAYLFDHRSGWGRQVGIGKTVVTTSMIDRIAQGLGRPLVEVPVGFKWFVDGLHDGSLGFAGEESAGASLLRRDGTPWTTDKDGIALGLLAAEMTATMGHDPGEAYRKLTARFGEPIYQRVDAPASDEVRAALSHLDATVVHETTIAGDPVQAVLTRAPGNNAPIGGLKVVTATGWFAVRPSGTEPVYKLYVESFAGPDHFDALQTAAREVIGRVVGGGRHAP